MYQQQQRNAANFIKSTLKKGLFRDRYNLVQMYRGGVFFYLQRRLVFHKKKQTAFVLLDKFLYHENHNKIITQSPKI